MDSFDDNQRQLRVSLLAIIIILPVGVIGYMLIEGVSLLDAIWITVTTLTTIGYGDLVATSALGRVFTLFLIVVGLGAFALAAQAAVQFFVSPMMRDVRQRKLAERKIRSMEGHYVICGRGQLVDKVIDYVIKQEELARIYQRERLAAPIDRVLERVLGRRSTGLRARVRGLLHNLVIGVLVRFRDAESIMDVVVIVTHDSVYAEQLRRKHLLVVEDDPTNDRALRRAGISRARAVMSLLEDDTETILNVLTIRSRSPNVHITATSDISLAMKVTRVGANNVLAPFEIAGQFLNNATLRPAVNDFFNSIMFGHRTSTQIIQLFIADDSPWLGKSLGELNLRDRFETGVIGLRLEDGHYLYAPSLDHIVCEDEVVLAVTPGQLIPELQADCSGVGRKRLILPEHLFWQRLPRVAPDFQPSRTYSLFESESDISQLSRHYVICGSSSILRSALSHLNPESPFVVLSDDNTFATEMLKRGFRVVYGDPTQEETLYRAGVDRALAIMVGIKDNAKSVLTILNCRTMNRNLLIVSMARTEDVIPKLRRAGADRVVLPFRIAAQNLLLATTRPTVSDFVDYVLYNEATGLETTELYMQDDSPWIGKRIGALDLHQKFDAGVIGLRLRNGCFVYAPADDHLLRQGEVLIVVTPMQNANVLRIAAHGNNSTRPRTLRDQDELQV